MQRRRDAPCSSASTVLINPVTPAAHERWPKFDFTEPMPQKPRRSVWLKTSVSAGELDRVAQDGAGAVRLDVADRLGGRYPHMRMRGANRRGLAAKARRGVSDLVVAVVVDRRAENHRADVVAVCERVSQALQHHDARRRCRRWCPGALASKGRQWPSGERIDPAV